MLKIVFTTSKSKRFKEALSLAKKLNCTIEESSYVVELKLSDVFNKWEYINSLLHIVDKWKGFEISYNDVVCTENKDYRVLFYAIQEIRSCYLRRLNIGANCEGKRKLGCWRLRSLAFDANEYGSTYWYKFGYFTDERTWTIDKEALWEHIDEEIKRMHAQICPMFSDNDIKKTISQLPNNINVGNLDKWKILYHSRITGDGVTKIPYSIEHIREDERPTMQNQNCRYNSNTEDLEDMWWRLSKQKVLTESEKADLLIDEYLKRKYGEDPF